MEHNPDSDILHLWAQGKTVAQIAAITGRSVQELQPLLADATWRAVSAAALASQQAGGYR